MEEWSYKQEREGYYYRSMVEIRAIDIYIWTSFVVFSSHLLFCLSLKMKSFDCLVPFSPLLFFFSLTIKQQQTQQKRPRERDIKREPISILYIRFSSLFFDAQKPNREEQQQPENTNGRRRTSLRNCSKLACLSAVCWGCVPGLLSSFFFFSSLSIYKTTRLYTLSLSLYRTSKSFHPSHNQSLQSFKHSKDYSL